MISRRTRNLIGTATVVAALALLFALSGSSKAIGARNRDIMAQFMIEAMTLSRVGGVIGIALLIPVFVTVLPTSVSVWSILTAFCFSMAVGVFFGVYPARKASLQDPIQALRYE